MSTSGRDLRKEGIGWASMAVIMVVFPILFFACVFFPIWMGWAP